MSANKSFSECSNEITENELGLAWINKGISITSLPYRRRVRPDRLVEYNDDNVNVLKQAIEKKLSTNVKCEFSAVEFALFDLKNPIKYYHYVRVGTPLRYFMPLGNIVSFNTTSGSSDRFSLRKTIPSNKKPVLKIDPSPTISSLINCTSIYGQTLEAFKKFEYWLIIYPTNANSPPIQEILLRSSQGVVNSQLLSSGIDLDRGNIDFKIVARGRLTSTSSRSLNLVMNVRVIEVPRPVTQSRTSTISV